MFQGGHITVHILNMTSEERYLFKKGMTDGIPIGLGYFAVAFSLGIAARAVGMNAVQGFIMSITSSASAGEYAGVAVMASAGTYFEMFLLTVVTDARYILMSFALSQRFPERLPLRHKCLLGFWLTDELFAITIARPGKVVPQYTYGAAIVSLFLWGLGTSLGIIVGNIIPERFVSALSVALFGMFIAIIVPPAKESKVVFWSVIASFVLSFAASRLLPALSDGTRMIILIVLICSVTAYLAPINTKEAADA